MNEASPGFAFLEWGVLSRFTDYVRLMSDGRVYLEDGVEEVSDGVFAYPLVGSGKQATDTVHMFGGTVRFTGHAGMLNLPLGALEIHLSEGDLCRIFIADPDEPQTRLLFATGTVSSADNSIRLAPVLEEDGSELYFYRYKAGLELEPAQIVFGDGKRRQPGRIKINKGLVNDFR
jgi:hypothetical protein